MKRIAGTELKQYFQDPDQVPNWWRPEDGRYKKWHKQEFRILDKHLKIEPSWRVLDAACGQGRFARYYAKKGCRVEAIDINARMLEMARDLAVRDEVGDKIDFHESDVEAFSHSGRDFDLVTCMDALDHMDDLHLAIKNLVRPLKEGGHFITTYTSTESLYGLMRDIFTIFSYRMRNSEVDIGKTYTFVEIKEALKAAGITIEHVFGIGMLMAPQERVRFPLFFNRVFEQISRADLNIKPYHANNWLASRCSGVMIMGRLK